MIGAFVSRFTMHNSKEEEELNLAIITFCI